MVFLRKTILSCFIKLMFTCSVVFASSNDHFIIKEGFAEVPGGTIWYEIVSTEQTKNKTPLLVVHGGPGVPHNYLSVLKKLANERPVIFYDQLGCGRSSIAKDNQKFWNIDRFELELAALVEHLHFNKIHLFGHSWGGGLAIKYAAKHPEKLTTLTVASPLLSTKVWVKDTRELLTQLPRDVQQTILRNEKQGTTDSKEYLNAVDVYYHHFVNRIKIWSEDFNYSLAHLSYPVYKTMWGPSEFTMTGNLKNFDSFPSLQKLKMPVLITGGKYDEATPATLTNAKKLFPYAQLIIYDQSSHMAFLEEEKTYLKDLRHFLAAHDD